MTSSKTYNELLSKFISFKSISTDKSFKQEVSATADFLISTFSENGFSTEKVEGYGNPIVLANLEVDPTLPTCLIYGHYDVQPAEKSDGWDSEPFEVREDENRIYARGIVDNKGQVLIHIATIIDLIKSGKIKYNIKFMVEGDEETGSPLMENFVKDYSEQLHCDFLMISDGEIISDYPVLDAGFRGGANTTLTLTTASTDTHSGIYGGGIPSASHEAGKFIDKLFDKNYHVQIPGFYDAVDEIPSEILENNKNIPFSKEELERITGVKSALIDGDYDIYTATSLRPTVQITGLQSGYVGEGYKNGIPAKSIIKANFRLVKSQNPEEIMEKYEQFIKDNLPEYVSYKLEISDPYEGIKLDLDNDYIKEAYSALEDAFGKKPFYKFSGGGLPIVTLFVEELGVKNALMVSLGNEDCNMHGINENFDKNILEKGLAFSRKFFGA